MYRPVQFREDRQEVLAAAIGELRFATLATFTGTQLLATHLPMVIGRGATGQLTINGHVARANPQWKQLDRSVDALATFVGPHAYVSPSWYASKAEHGRVVPTWNYIAIQAVGPLTIFEEPDWLMQHLAELTDHNEAARPEPWRLSDAPPGFAEQLCSAIVGVSLEVRSLEGTWKMAQHRSEPDRLGVIEGLRTVGEDSSDRVAAEMARLEAERRKPN